MTHILINQVKHEVSYDYADDTGGRWTFEGLAPFCGLCRRTFPKHPAFEFDAQSSETTITCDECGRKYRVES